MTTGGIEDGTGTGASVAALPKRSMVWAVNRLLGFEVPLELRQIPLPENSPQQPNAQFWAPGGFSQEVRAEMQFHKTELVGTNPHRGRRHHD